MQAHMQKLRQQGTLLIYSITFVKERAVFSEINLKKSHRMNQNTIVALVHIFDGKL